VARRLAAAKKRRELDPALEVVTRAIDAANAAAREAAGGGNGSIDTERLRNLRELMEKINGIFEMFIDDKTGGRRYTERPNNS
jgi:hypothetical protein